MRDLKESHDSDGYHSMITGQPLQFFVDVLYCVELLRQIRLRTSLTSNEEKMIY